MNNIKPYNGTPVWGQIPILFYVKGGMWGSEYPRIWKRK